MSKFTKQVLLLTRQNVKVRFAHRCLSFCELILPLIIALVMGSMYSYENLTYKNTHSNDGISEHSSEGSSVPSKFYCEDSYNRNGRACETWYNSVNQFNKKPELYHDENEKIIFVATEEVAKMPAGLDLVDLIMKNVAKYITHKSISTTRGKYRGMAQNEFEWVRTNQSEKELETCILQQHSFCENLSAAVVVTNVVDEVNTKKKIQVEYKIRRMVSYGVDPEDFSTDSVFVDYNSEMSRKQDLMEDFYLGSSLWRREPTWFIELQAFVDRAVMDFVNSRLDNYNQTENENQVSPSLATPSSWIEISLVRMPFIYPSEDNIETSQYVPVIFCLLGSFAIFSLMRINTVKSSGFKELLRMHGVSVSTQWMAWMLSSFLVYSVWTLVVTLLLWLPLLGGANVLIKLNVNGILFWLLLLFTMMALTSFSFLISVFFERVWTAASVGLLIWILLTVVMMLIKSSFHGLTHWSRVTVMFIPTVAFDYAIRLFLNGGGTLATSGTPVIENVSLTTLHCLSMLFLDSCVYMTLAVYLDNVIPSKYGVSRSPWYIVRNCRKLLRRLIRRDMNKYDLPSLDNNTNRMRETTSSMPPEQPFESDPEHGEVAVVIKNLKKLFRRSKIPAVDGLSIQMFKGEIFTLLGFNGAGKTTTIGMLTGLDKNSDSTTPINLSLTSPTDGFASIFGLDIKKDMEEIRRYTGLCPQHNLLYDDMSVVDQVAFFGTLKGLTDSSDKAKELLTCLGMADKLESTPKQLSGGQKRRVHLAIALIGNPKLAFLDEPTSGLDPEVRRAVWDILLKLRGKTTIVLTTHDMEEADVLGDRIGIMADGKMVCSGTPSFLKKYFEVGYNLKMSAVAYDFNADKVLKFVRKYISTAKLNLLCGSTSCVNISLPFAGMDSGRLADLMETIQAQKSVLGVDNIGLSLATMDEVFLKVGETVRVVDVGMSVSYPTIDKRSAGKYEGTQLQLYRFLALVLKRAMYFCSAPFTLLFLVLLFGTFLWLSLIKTYPTLWLDNPTYPPRVVSSLRNYHSLVILLHDDSNYGTNNNNVNYAISYKAGVRRQYGTRTGLKIYEFQKDVSITDIMESLKTRCNQDPIEYRHHYVAGVSFNHSENRTNIIGLFSAYALHGAPLSLNLISQSHIKKLYGVDANITVINHPFQTTKQFKWSNRWNVDGEFYLQLAGCVILLVIIASLMTSTAAFLPTEERLNKGKQLQLMTGTTPFIYWMSMFTWDFPFFSLLNVFITSVYFLAEAGSPHKVFTGHGAGVVIYLILECHTFAALWFSYLISWASCIKTPSDGFLIVNKFALIVGIFINVLSHILVSGLYYEVVRETPNSFSILMYYISNFSKYILWPEPMYSLYLSMIKLATIGIGNNICNTFPAEVRLLSCEAVDGFERSTNNINLIRSCCENCKENCFVPQPYVSTAPVTLLVNYTTHGLLFDILAMFFSGLLSAGILFSLEYLLPSIRQNRQRGATSRMSERQIDPSIEEDVLVEAARINDVVDSNTTLGETLGFIAHDIHLNFGSLKAVNGLSFGVAPGECFGLLGVSGSGKTSTFRIITGDAIPTSGKMFSGKQCYHSDLSSYLATMGYCPQFDGIIGRLTGLQMVKLYGALRGIPPASLTEHAKIWLLKFGLLCSANMKCGAYSGGMKRRLSVAMALIGNPAVILLDEPTSGVDPAFRRQFWNAIIELKRNKHSIVLSSYTMEECETLCTRLGIMVGGQFKCLGNIRHLKSKYGKGYILTIRLKKVTVMCQNANDLINEVHETILKKFTPCIVQSRQVALMQYQILNKSVVQRHFSRNGTNCEFRRCH